MFLYARPFALICPVCTHVMVAAEQTKYACADKECRMFSRWFDIQLPLITAYVCEGPSPDPFFSGGSPS